MDNELKRWLQTQNENTEAIEIETNFNSNNYFTKWINSKEKNLNNTLNTG